jgi:hypothetical protein
VVCWGWNEFGQTNVPNLTNPTQVSLQDMQICALDDSGVVCWGDDSYVPALTNPIKISSGWSHTCAIDDSGVVCWGNNDSGQTDVPNLTNPTQISSGSDHTCALDDSGVVCWGANVQGQTDEPNLSNPTLISLGGFHSCALDDSGTVCWGANNSGQTNVPNLINPKVLTSRWDAVCALDDTGVVCWGNNDYGQTDVPNFIFNSAASEITVPELVADTQHVYVSETALSEDGSQLTVKLSYLVDDATLTGTGFVLNFDDSVLSLDSVSDVASGAVGFGALNDDGNGLVFAWADPFGVSWPGATEADLATITFNIAEGATGSALFSMRETSIPHGYTFDGQAQLVEVVPVDPVVPNDPSVSPINITSRSNTPGFEFVGLNCILSTDLTDSLETVVAGSGDTSGSTESADNCATPGELDQAQVVYVSNTTVVGNQKTVTISYASDDPTLTGVGIRIHFDSSEMTLQSTSNVFATGKVGEITVDDVDDFDSDPETDSMVILAWADPFGGAWPGSENTELLTLIFEVKKSWDFDQSGDWDFDQSGDVDALTDGLLLLRYAFGLRGNKLTAGVLAHSSIMTSQEVEQAIEGSSQMNDIDGDGEVNALTDGLLLLRYLFGLRDSNLINGVISENAFRTDATAVEAYIESYMP